MPYFISRNILIFSLFFLLHCQRDPASIESEQGYPWESTRPESQNIDPVLLSAAFQEAEHLGFVDGLLVIRNGYLIKEKYYNGFSKNSRHNVMSVSKSFLSALVGIALDQGYLDSLNQKVLDFFPEYVYSGMDPRKNKITIRHLLMMRAGIDNDENTYFEIYQSSNWIRTTLELPLLFDPGNQMRYNTFQTHLLSAILTKSTGMSTPQFAKQYLLQPLRISVGDWEQDPQGYYFGGNSMHFTPRDMARLGYLHLNDGFIDGQQMIPADWVAESLTNYSGFKNLTWGDLQNYNYGYLWWLGELNNYEAFLALGHGGQFIINLPELHMIIVSTAENRLDWETADEHERAILHLVTEYILPAVMN